MAMSSCWVGGDVLLKRWSDGVPEPVAHFAELEKSGAHRHDQAGAEQQRQTRRAPDHSVNCIVDLRDPFQHGKFPPLTQNKKADRTHQRLCLQKFRRIHFPLPGTPHSRRSPCAYQTMALSFCLRDTAAFPCGLTPSAPAAAGFSRVQGNASPHVFSVLSLCTAVHDRKTILYFAPMCKLFFHLMPHAPPECKAEWPEPACRVGAFSADVRGFQLPPYCLRQQGPTLGSSAGETPAPQAKNTTAPGRRGIGSGRRGRQCL